MTCETFEKAKELKYRIDKLEKFIKSCEGNRFIRFYKTISITATASDYLRTPEIYDCSPDIRDKFITVLKEEVVKMKNEFNELGGVQE